MQKRCLSLIPALVVVMLGASAPASADWLFTPYLGINFGGAANFGDVGDVEDEFERKSTFGGTLTFMGGGIVGFDLDFAVAPNFFEITTGDADFDFGDGNLTTIMGNLVLGAPIGGQSGGGARPYASGGIGLIRSRVDFSDLFDNISTSQLGVNAGGGVYVFFNDRIGLRGDVRYFRSLQDDEGDDDRLGFSDFDFWRGTIGVTFRFGG